MSSYTIPKMADRQVGRNAELFAAAIGRLQTPEARLPYLRILVSIIEQAHPEWINSPRKAEQIAGLISEMNGAELCPNEIGEAIRVRDTERNGAQN
jgi:hypothetical protein